MSKLLPLILLAFSTSALALGPEEMELFGVIPQNKSISLQFKEDPNIYGSSMSPLHFCRLEYLDDKKSKISCSANKNSKPDVIYMNGSKTQPEFKNARQIFLKNYGGKRVGEWSENGAYNDEYFVCKTGCSNSIPHIFILITHGD